MDPETPGPVDTVPLHRMYVLRTQESGTVL